MYGYIYMILNKVNGKTYIGQRKSTKFCYDDKYMGSGKKLASAKKHYGIENFEKLLIQYVETKEEANEQEIFWIAHYRERGMAQYNIADGGHTGPGLGHKVSEEARKKISEAHKGKGHTQTKETREKISKSLKGRPAQNKGIPRSEETKQKIREKIKVIKHQKKLGKSYLSQIKVCIKECIGIL